MTELKKFSLTCKIELFRQVYTTLTRTVHTLNKRQAALVFPVDGSRWCQKTSPGTAPSQILAWKVMNQFWPGQVISPGGVPARKMHKNLVDSGRTRGKIGLQASRSDEAQVAGGH